MSSTEALAEKAIRRFQSGYNCAQRVPLILYEHIEPERKYELIPKIAADFGGGIGRCGSVCRALTGSIVPVESNMHLTKLELKNEQRLMLTLKRFSSNLRRSMALNYVET